MIGVTAGVGRWNYAAISQAVQHGHVGGGLAFGIWNMVRLIISFVIVIVRCCSRWNWLVRSLCFNCLSRMFVVLVYFFFFLNIILFIVGDCMALGPVMGGALSFPVSVFLFCCTSLFSVPFLSVRSFLWCFLKVAHNITPHGVLLSFPPIHRHHDGAASLPHSHLHSR